MAEKLKFVVSWLVFFAILAWIVFLLLEVKNVEKQIYFPEYASVWGGFHMPNNGSPDSL